jgi:hypothetical protein
VEIVGEPANAEQMAALRYATAWIFLSPEDQAMDWEECFRDNVYKIEIYDPKDNDIYDDPDFPAPPNWTGIVMRSGTGFGSFQSIVIKREDGTFDQSE